MQPFADKKQKAMGTSDQSANTLDCRSSGQGWTPGRGRVKAYFSVLLSPPINAPLTFVCTACTMTLVQIKNPTSTFQQEEDQQHGNTQINSRREIQTMLVATVNVRHGSRKIRMMTVATANGSHSSREIRTMLVATVNGKQ